MEQKESTDNLSRLMNGENLEDIVSTPVEETKAPITEETEENTETTNEEVGEEKNPIIEASEKQPSLDEFIKTNFEGFESVDSIKEQLKKVTEFEEANKSLSEKANKYDSVNKEYEDYKTKNPYNDAELYRLSKLKSDEEGYKTTTKLLYGNTSPEEVLKLNFISKHPEYKDKPEEVSRLVLSEYNIELKPEVDDLGDSIEANIQYNKDRKELAQDKMTLAAATAKTELLSKFNSIEVPKSPKTDDEINADIKKKTEEFTERWKQPFNSLQADIKSFDFSQEIGENKIPIEIELDESEQKDLSKYVADVIFRENMEPNEESIASVKQMAMNAYKRHNINKIVEKAVSYAMSSSDESWRERVTNSSPDVNTDKVIETKSDKQAKALEELFNLDK